MSDTVLAVSGFTQEAFDAFIEHRDEPQWLQQQRRDAWQAFCDLPFPSRSEEEWMRTDIRLFKLDRFGLPPRESASLPPRPALRHPNVELSGSAVSVDGVAQRADVGKVWADRGVIFGSLSDVVRRHGDLVQQYLLSQAVDFRVDKFSALHAACWSSGTFLYVPRGVVIDQPIHVQSAIGSAGTDLGHTLIVLDDGAEATFLSESSSCDSSQGGFHCGATELILGSRSKLQFVHLQDWGPHVWQFAHQKALVDADATLQWTAGALGSRLSKVNQQVELVGAGAECQVNGVMFTEGSQHLSYHTLQHHVAPHCRSDFLYKAALQDKSRTVWRGMIKVDPTAQKTDGYQRNDNLLLSGQARADAIPGLEIEADDVRCTHGATTGRVDDELIFYAQSRGFTRREAIRIVVTGFFQQVFDRIMIESVREALAEAIARRVRDYD